MAQPIWKDYYVTLEANPSIYRIIESTSGDVLYVGRAWKRPGSTAPTVRINDVVADYLDSRVRSLPTIAQATFTSTGLVDMEFVTQEMDSADQDWIDEDNVAFDWNWSYDYGFNDSYSKRSFPIDGRIDSRQPIFYSIYDGDRIIATRRYKSGSTSNIAINLDDNPHSGTGVFLPKSWNNLVQVEIMSVIYRVVTSCAKYAIYYMNPYGGWDHYLVRGEVKESDTLTRHVRKLNYDNTSIVNRGEDNYVNEVVKTYVVNSGALTDAEAARMPYLLNSAVVYLYDFASEEFIPVTITDTVSEYKTTKGEGLKMINYVITLRVAQDMIVR